MGSHAKLNRPFRDGLIALLQPLTCHPIATKQLWTNLSGGSGESIRAEFGVSAAVAAQFGPSVFARNDVGVGDTNLGGRVEMDILGQSSYENTPISGVRRTVVVNTLSKGLVSGE